VADEPSQAPPHSGLTGEELAAIVEALAAKYVPKPCEMCEVDNWVVAPHLASPVLLNRDGEQVTPNYNLLQTSVVLLCSNCGNTKMFSLGTLGVRFRG
jgi:hypothetical protein